MSRETTRTARAAAVFWTFALLASALGQAERSYEDHAVVRAVAREPADIDRIEQTGAIILNCTHGPGKLDVVVSPEQLAELDRLGISTALVEANVHDAVQAQKQPRAVVAAGGDPFDDFFLDYHPYDGVGGIAWYLNELVARYPALVSMVDVGTTLEGRTIWGVRITASAAPDTPGVLYFGAEHAREWVTPPVVLYFARHLLENYGTDPTVTELVDSLEFYLVPVFNVDGYIYSWTNDRFWRKNRRNNGSGTFGVDINRNWGEGWGGPGSSGSSSSQTYRGTSPFSEPETQALRDFILAHPNLRAQLDIHSYSQLILWPYGYTPALTPDEPYYADVGFDMQALIQGVHGRFYAAGAVYGTIYPASGVSVDWTHAERDMLSMSFECRDTGTFGFLLPAEQIIPNCEELVPAILRMTNTDWVREPVRYQLPDGVPTTIQAGETTTVLVEIIAQTDSIEAGTPALNYRYDPAGSFTQIPLTPLGGTLYQAALPPTNCTSEPEYYFSVQTAGGSTVTNPMDADEADYHTAVMETGRTTVMAFDLSSDPGWSTQGLWSWGQPTGGGGQGGGPDPTSGYTGDHVYGYNLNGDYENNLGPRHLTTPPLDLSGRAQVRLEYRRWLGVEVPAWDHASIAASTNGTDWTTVWENSGEVADSSWQPHSVDLSSLADGEAAVRLRWTMGPTDTAFQYCGWNIDDVAITAGECNGLVGDYDGDGTVDATDYDEFESCYSGGDVQRGPGCAVFDADSDGDVDCADWGAFYAAWTGPDDPPTFAPCPQLPAPGLTGTGSRYFTITGLAASEPIAIHVSSPDRPCLSAYVDLDAGAENPPVGRLVDSPVYRMPAEWGDPLPVADAPIGPSMRFVVHTVTEGGTPSLNAETETFAWGDVDDPIGTLSVLDVAGSVDCIKGLATSPSVEQCDLDPEVPDRITNVLDLSRTVDALKGLGYPFTTSCP